MIIWANANQKIIKWKYKSMIQKLHHPNGLRLIGLRDGVDLDRAKKRHELVLRIGRLRNFAYFGRFTFVAKGKADKYDQWKRLVSQTSVAAMPASERNVLRSMLHVKVVQLQLFQNDRSALLDQ
jgi:hypothetical protein